MKSVMCEAYCADCPAGSNYPEFTPPALDPNSANLTETLFPCTFRVLPLVVPPAMGIRYKRSYSVTEQTLGTQELTRGVPNYD